MVYREILLPIALEFCPDIVLVSAGQDPHKDDPLGGMRLTSDGFGAMGGVVKEIADVCCKGRLAATLEGGYNLQAQAEAIVAEIKAFQGIIPTVKGRDPKIAQRIEEVKKIQSSFWRCFK
jgi:acetoin utilization deacetylase AcuC-like enzyme